MTELAAKPILVAKRGALSGSDKSKLTKAGYVVIESALDDPIKVVPSVAIPVDTLGIVHAALKALSGSEWARTQFGKHIVEAMLLEFDGRGGDQRG